MSKIHSRKEKELLLVIEGLRKGTKILATKLRKYEREIIKLNARIIELERRND